MALLVIAGLLSPRLVTPPPPSGAQGNVMASQVSGVPGPDDLEPASHQGGTAGWAPVQLAPTGPCTVRR